MQRSPKKVNFERRGGGWLDLQTDAAKLHQKVSPWRKGGGWGYDNKKRFRKQTDFLLAAKIALLATSK